MDTKFFFLFFILSAGTLSNLSGQDSSYVRNDASSNNNKILIINSFDAMSVNARKNKRELFKELTDSLKNYLAKKIKGETNYEPVIIPGIVYGNDSLVFSLLNDNKTAKAILIRSLEVYFDETGERETTNSDGKPQVTTDYDLCAKVEYTFYNSTEKAKETKIDNCKYFTSRSVKDGHFVLSFGPDIVGKKKHTYGAVEKNAEQYVLEITLRFSEK
jgi:hypothetical protein